MPSNVAAGCHAIFRTMSVFCDIRRRGELTGLLVSGDTWRVD